MRINNQLSFERRFYEVYILLCVFFWYLEECHVRYYLLQLLSEESIVHVFELCIQEYLKEPLSASLHVIHTLCKDQDCRKLTHCASKCYMFLVSIINIL